MGLNTGFTKVGFGQSEVLDSTMWTVAHVKGTDNRFIAVNGDYSNIDTVFNADNTFWKRAVQQQETRGHDSNGRPIEVDFVRTVQVNPRGLSNGERYLAAVAATQEAYYNSSVYKAAQAGPSADRS